MKNFLLITSLLLLANLLLLAGPAFSSDMQLEDGEWEMTTKMTMEGMPAGMSMPPMTFRQCISKEKMVPSQERHNQDCEKLEQDVSGSTVTWSMRCTTNGVVSEMNGSSTYTGNTMKGTMHMTSQGMKMTSHVTGKRLGPCK